jgi:lipopolysaccharide transport system permease protein
LRDLNQLISVVVSMLMFLSPIFFPLSALPARWQPLLSLNPLANLIEQTRLVLVTGKVPDPSYILGSIAITVFLCELSYRIFSKGKRAFADVI